MKLLITGASGFLGRYTVIGALRREHAVRALVRPTVDDGELPWVRHPRVELVQLDLRSSKGLAEAISGVECVIHLAAARRGDFSARFEDTVLATENLIDAMVEAGADHLVAISSFAVYDFYHCPSHGVFDESAATEANPEKRHAYTQTKLMQEQLLRTAAVQHQWKLTVVRPGAVFGKGSMWSTRLGFKLSDGLWVRTGAWARLPLTYVENCAEAIVLCAELPDAVGETFNVVDDDQPRQRRYLNILRSWEQPAPRVIPLSWTSLRFISWTAGLANRFLFQGRARLPALLVRENLHASCKPLCYSNRKLREVLGWRPRYNLAEAVERSFGADGLSYLEGTRTGERTEARSRAS